MSSDSEIIGRRTFTPRTLKIPKHHNPEGWYTGTHEALGISDCQQQQSVQATTNIWAADNRYAWTGCYPSTKHKETSRSARGPASKTVEDIEKWLKTRPGPSPLPDDLKSDAVVDRYPELALSSAFLPYDPPYDQFHELHSEKYLEVCKDGFILPEFPLDNLDTLTSTDMMVAGEILPSTSTHLDFSDSRKPEDAQKARKLDISTENGGHLNPVQNGGNSNSPQNGGNSAQDGGHFHCEENTDNLSPVQDNLTFHEDRDNFDENNINLNTKESGGDSPFDENDDNLHSDEDGEDLNFGDSGVNLSSEENGDLNFGDNDGNLNCEDGGDLNFGENGGNFEEGDVGDEESLEEISGGHEMEVVEEFEELEEIDESVAPGKRKLGEIEASLQKGESKEGIMAVVAISTDKMSNMTQIVINTGKEEQIYQGKTSELMEATGYFPEIPKIEGWGKGEGREGGGTSHEGIITNALEELGFTEESLISMALTATETGKTWVCPKEDCKREFSRLYALKGHLLAHYGVRPFKCDFPSCTWAFHSDFKLKRHKETHLKRKDYVCPVADCNRRFTTIYNLWTHEKLHSRPSAISCTVPDCNDRFQTKRALELHMKTHDQSHAPYVCPHPPCGKRYYSSNALTSHLRCHSYKDVDIKCAWIGCGKVFDKPCRLKAHIRSHTGSKPYACAFPGCDWAFSSSSKLKRHEKKHTNERKFLCDFPSCSKAFMRSEHLKEHRLTHKEGRLFECYMCDTRFSAKSSLYVHIKKHQNRENNGSVENQKSSFDKFQKEEAESVKIICEELAQNSEIQAQQNGGAPPKNGGKNSKIGKKSQSGGKKIQNGGNQPQNGERNSQNGGKNSQNFGKFSQNSGKILENGENYSKNSEEILENGGTDHSMFGENFFEKCENRGREGRKRGRAQGAARTGLTCEDVWKMKRGQAGPVGPSDVVLGGAHLGEELLLTEEFQEMFYEDMGGGGDDLGEVFEGGGV